VFKNSNFIERSIMGALSFLRDSIFADEYALKNGLLQSFDPRVKTATLLLFIIQVLFTKSIIVLLLLYVFCLLLSCLSKIHLSFFLKRTWVFIPLFSLLIAIPAMFSIFTPGEQLAAFKILGAKFIITHQGLSTAALFVSRVVTSVSFAILLSITTKHTDLLRVLRIFKIPQIFVMTLGMCYRYIYLFVEIIEDTFLAIKSRVGTVAHHKKGQSIVAWNMAYLWQRSYHLNEDVYKAMLSRGYSGDPRVLDEFKSLPIDLFWVCLVVTISALLFYLDYIVRV